MLGWLQPRRGGHPSPERSLPKGGLGTVGSIHYDVWINICAGLDGCRGNIPIPVLSFALVGWSQSRGNDTRYECFVASTNIFLQIRLCPGNFPTRYPRYSLGSGQPRRRQRMIPKLLGVKKSPRPLDWMHPTYTQSLISEEPWCSPVERSGKYQTRLGWSPAIPQSRRYRPMERWPSEVAEHASP